MYRFRATVTASALAAGAEETYTITETRNGGAQVATETRKSDAIVVNPTAATMATNPGLSVGAAWVSAPGVIKVKVTNDGASVAFTAGAMTLDIAVVR